MSNATVNVAEYLFTRLNQLGVKDLHGVPGDFNLVALDYVEPCGLNWVGNCNELNAGYAADAYGRLMGMGALVTTFGVGELSCLNAIAGSFAEFCPVVHIVGTPKRAAQKSGMLLHHTLGNGDFNVFADMSKPITIAQTNLMDPATAPAEIDRVLQACYVNSRPVYIQLPADMVMEEVDAGLLDTPVDVKPPQSDRETENLATEIILRKLYAAKRPTLLLDAGAQRHRVEDLTEEFARKTGLPTFITPMGKGVANEESPNYAGIYIGKGSEESVRTRIEESDCVITIGNVKSDVNSFGFSYRIGRLTSVDLHFDHVVMDCAKFENVYMKWLLERLVREVEPSKMQMEKVDMPVRKNVELTNGEAATQDVTHAWLWPRISSWLRTGDVVITETGTSFVGIWETKFPAGVQAINQTLWSSIGYGLGAAQGAALAMKTSGGGRRTVCFEGDGSFQLTAQELSTIIRQDLDCTIFLIENDGYEIERWVHGMKAKYNDISKWRYSKIADVFTPEEEVSQHRVKSYKVSTRSGLEELLADEEFSAGKGLHFVELHMPRYNAPQTLIDFAQSLSKKPS
ncbi:indole-3-pyruvate decarboxylase [Aureobasidium pullulans]|uniref:Pyruvate decarboxylase n=1 Tax=Aureobasidium pullulans TaxID=5580 RepID=A0A4S9L964_AURPU|nr:indole-3-pyruvate decarboxylase [Aureobasidium pullulans]